MPQPGNPVELLRIAADGSRVRAGNSMSQDLTNLSGTSGSVSTTDETDMIAAVAGSRIIVHSGMLVVATPGTDEVVATLAAGSLSIPLAFNAAAVAYILPMIVCPAGEALTITLGSAVGVYWLLNYSME